MQNKKGVKFELYITFSNARTLSAHVAWQPQLRLQASSDFVGARCY